MGLILAAGYFHKYTLGGVYFALASGSYWTGFGLDRLFAAARFAGAPWIGWALCGLVLGAVIGFCAIAPVYGLRRWRWAMVGLVFTAMLVIALLPVSLPAGPDPDRVPDVFGPVVRIDGRIVVDRGDKMAFRFKVFDQAPRAKVRIVIAQRSGATLATYRAGWVPTGKWRTLRYTCRLRPGEYRYTITAVDKKGQAAVRNGRAGLRVRAK